MYIHLIYSPDGTGVYGSRGAWGGLRTQDRCRPIGTQYFYNFPLRGRNSKAVCKIIVFL